MPRQSQKPHFVQETNYEAVAIGNLVTEGLDES